MGRYRYFHNYCLGGDGLRSRWRIDKRLIGVSAVAVVALFGVAAWNQGRVWATSITLFKHALEVTSENRLAHYNLGNAYAKQGRWGDAVPQYKKAIKIDPEHTQTYNHLGFVYFKLGRMEDAITQYAVALKINPVLKEIHKNMGNALAVNGELDKAILHYKAAIGLDQEFAKPYINMGPIKNSTVFKQLLEKRLPKIY